jgi:RNA polymerase sigma-70 factor (ECF subfamily)
VRGTKLDQDGVLIRDLYARHAAALSSYLRRALGGDRYLAEDIIQETMLRAWRSRADLDVRTARPWLFTTARRLVIDYYRKTNARPAEISVGEFDVLTDADGIDRALDALLVAEALAALSSQHRQVLIDCYYRGRTVAQVAEERHLPAGTVRSRLYYALSALRLALQERGVSS